MPTSHEHTHRILVDELLDGPRTRRDACAGYDVELIEHDERGVLRLSAPDGRLCLTIHLDPAGPRLEVAAASVAVRAEKTLHLGCETLDIAAARDISIRAGGTLETEAFSQVIRARTGDIHVHANDDVRVDGERIHLNSPYTHQPRTPPDREG